ncbi:MAG TPA: thiamine pyrophosphate-binding protein, partial [Thermomicrobiales bacterium]|nr:thiamine pyrophosphate-binding protein [Thermomicrobiales bacterium]
MGAELAAGGPGRTGAAALIDALAAQGTRYLFGIPGVHTLLPFDLLHAHPTIRPVVTRHEGGAGFAADGYARASGEPGVCLVVPGPGATNLATAALVAQSDRVPLVLITTTVPARLAGRQAVHESDLAALYRPLVKAQVAIEDAGEIAPAVARAFALARAEPPGPVQLALPYDLFAHPAGPQPAGAEQGVPRPPAWGGRGGDPSPADLERALALLRAARAPLLYAGHGVVRAGAGPALVALAEALGAP